MALFLLHPPFFRVSVFPALFPVMVIFFKIRSADLGDQATARAGVIKTLTMEVFSKTQPVRVFRAGFKDLSRIFSASLFADRNFSGMEIF